LVGGGEYVREEGGQGGRMGEQTWEDADEALVVVGCEVAALGEDKELVLLVICG
jgi:hypothetical protein